MQLSMGPSCFCILCQQRHQWPLFWAVLRLFGQGTASDNTVSTSFWGREQATLLLSIIEIISLSLWSKRKTGFRTPIRKDLDSLHPWFFICTTDLLCVKHYWTRGTLEAGRGGAHRSRKFMLLAVSLIIKSFVSDLEILLLLSRSMTLGQVTVQLKGG